MNFEVSYSAEARQDLRDIYGYIAYELLVPATAAGQTERIMKAPVLLNKCQCETGYMRKNLGIVRGCEFYRWIII